jgi:hypothetical protein
MHSYLVSLRISGKKLDPSIITSELGMEPSQVRVKGEPCPGGHSAWDESTWEYEVRASNENGNGNRWNKGCAPFCQSLIPGR